MSRVNIIMAAYNGEKYIKEQIESIQNSYFTNWKLWIFDDGSKDGTKEIVNQFVQNNSDKIHYIINEKNKGVTRNFLEAILHIDGEINNYTEETVDETKEYYMFCDQDDMWMPDKIDRTLSRMKKAEKKFGGDKVLAVFTDAVVVDEHLNEIYPSFYMNSKLDTEKTDLPHILMENKLIGCTIMFNYALKNKIKTIPHNVRYHDWWIALIAAAFGHIIYLPEPTLLYRQHSNNVVGNQNFAGYVKKRAVTLDKQKEVLQQTILQGKEFYQIYQDELHNKVKKQAYTFAHIQKRNWLMKRVLILTNGYIKTGFVRNLGLFLII